MPIREARWLKSPDLVADLITQPAECLEWPKDETQRRNVAIGRELFRSPLMLGGQAARAGLSCSSCHRNGRTNPHFHFPGISGDPGTADVTASIMSSHRGDGTFNPKPIPDLGGDPAKLKISRDPAKNDLSKFLHGLVTQEFDGTEPSQAAVESIAAYVRALKPQACPKETSVPITLDDKITDLEWAVSLAHKAYADGDRATGRELLAAARSTLGAINERFELASLKDERARLRAADAILFGLQEAGGKGHWRRWMNEWPAHKRALRAAERQSLFNPAVLRKLVS